MSKKDKPMEKPRKWRTIAIEVQWLEELQKEATRQSRKPTAMLNLILKERYAPK